jgi:hypothetical protein
MPSTFHMNGPLSAAPKERKERKKTCVKAEMRFCLLTPRDRQKDKVAEQVEGEATEQRAQASAAETGKRVVALHKKLKHLEKVLLLFFSLLSSVFINCVMQVNLFKLLFDPTSYGKTVENIFHYSFLIKVGGCEFSSFLV